MRFWAVAMLVLDWMQRFGGEDVTAAKAQVHVHVLLRGWSRRDTAPEARLTQICPFV